MRSVREKVLYHSQLVFEVTNREKLYAVKVATELKQFINNEKL